MTKRLAGRIIAAGALLGISAGGSFVVVAQGAA